jgi:hypothetical protein
MPPNNALVQCHDCGKEVSRRAAACPNCGCPMGDPAHKAYAQVNDVGPTRDFRVLVILTALMVIGLLTGIGLGAFSASPGDRGAGAVFGGILGAVMLPVLAYRLIFQK